jgi:hypothetical protein
VARQQLGRAHWLAVLYWQCNSQVRCMHSPLRRPVKLVVSARTQAVPCQGSSVGAGGRERD